jgi:outer membrane protein assembly factor BamB
MTQRKIDAHSLILAMCVLTLLPAVSGRCDENWTGFRGPTDQGHSNAVGLPIQWSETQNVVWKTAIEGKAWSSPVIWGDRIWVTTAPDSGVQLTAQCIDKNSGKVLIKKRLRTVVAPQYCHPYNSYASPSPVIEHGRVYVTFGAPYMGCLDTKSGAEIWKRTDFVCNHFRGAGSSPLLYKDLLIQHFDGADRQYLVAMNKKTGVTVWKTDRAVDFKDIDPETGGPTREGDLRKAFSTPIVAEVNGKPILLSLGSMALYAYDVMTGEELWRVVAHGSHSGTCRPVVGHGLIFMPMGMKGELRAIRPGGNGDVTDTHVVWEHKKAVPKRSSPLLIGDLLFLVDNDGVASCLEAKTGNEVWRHRLGANYAASPIHADGRVYFFDEKGKSTVIEPGREYKELAENHLDEGFMASPAVSGNALFLRTRTHLYRIEKK